MPPESKVGALERAVTHLESAAACLEEAAPSPGHLDLVAKAYIASATAVIETARNQERNQEKAKRAGAG